jgi:hypothetical protein
MSGTTHATTLADYWRDHIEEWQRSGLSQMAYCATQQLAYHRFVYWRQKLQGERGKAQLKLTSALVPVSYRPSPTSSQLTLSLPNGMTVGGILADNVTLIPQLLEQLK